MQGPLNIILLTIDSMRYDHLSLFGYPRCTTPLLDDLCRNHSCLKSVARANAPYTKAAFKSIMTGLLPFSGGGYHSVDGYRTLAELFSRAGFHTLGIPNNPLTSSAFGYNKGFDFFMDLTIKPVPVMKKIIKNLMTSRHPVRLYKELSTTAIVTRYLLRGGRLCPYLPIKNLLGIALRFLKNTFYNKKFIWIHSMDVHYPWMLRPDVFHELHGERFSIIDYLTGYISLLNKVYYDIGLGHDVVETIVKMYDASIRTIDEELSSFFKTLERMGLIDTVLLIVTADHGEEFLEHGAIGHTGKKFLTHMYEELLRVPFMIIDFSGKVLEKDVIKRINNAKLMQVDILPTLLDILGIKDSIRERVDGVSLLDVSIGQLKERIHISEASLFNYGRGHIVTRPIVMRPTEKIILSIVKGNKKVVVYDRYYVEAFDLKQDPREEHGKIIAPRRGKQDDDTIELLLDLARRRLRLAKKYLLKERVRRRLKG